MKILRAHPRNSRNPRLIVTGSYLILAGLTIAYELSIRIYDTGHSEFAGMLSFALTLPASILSALIASWGFGVRVGDSNTSFVVILVFGALVNAYIVYVIVGRLRK
jgi:hypothetical protein